MKQSLIAVILCLTIYFAPTLAQDSQRTVISTTNAQQVAKIKTIGRGTVSDLAWSPDGNTLALATGLGVWLYDTSNYNATPLLLGNQEIGASRIAYSPDGTKLAVRTGEGIMLWDIEENEALLTLEIKTSTFAFHPTAPILATGGAYQDERLRLWNTETGELNYESQSVCGSVSKDLTYSPDGTWIAMDCFSTYSLEIRNGETGEKLESLKQDGMRNTSFISAEEQALYFLMSAGKGHPETHVASSNGLLYVGDIYGGMWVWDVENKMVNDRWYYYNKPVRSLALSSDELTLAVALGDNEFVDIKGIPNEVWLYDTTTNEPKLTIEGIQTRISKVVFSPDGSKLVTLSSIPQVWDVNTGELIAEFDKHTVANSLLSIQSDNTTFISGVYNNSIQLWDTETEERIDVAFSGHTDRISSATLNNDSTLVASHAYRLSDYDPTIRIWDVASGNLHAELLGHTSGIHQVVFSPHDELLVSSSSYDNTVKIWDTTSGEVVLSIDDILEPWTIALSPDGQMLVVADKNHVIHVFDFPTGEKITELIAHTGIPQCLLFDPTSTILISGCAYSENEVYLWNMNNFEILSVLKAPDIVGEVVINPDASRLITASDNGDLIVWNMENGEQVAVLQGHTSRVSARFSPDGSLVASASLDSSARLWNAETGEELNLFTTHPSLSILFSPDGTILYVSSNIGVVHMFAVEKD